MREIVFVVWEVGTVSRKNTHPLIREYVNEVDAASEQKRDPDNKKKYVCNTPPGIPDDDKDRKDDNDSGEFDNTVEEEVVLEADEV